MKKTIFSLLALVLTLAVTAQCYPDRHNTSWHDAWISCQETMNPNESRGESHWIHYDLGHLYILGEMTVWNINDPSNLDRGAQNIVIDYSTDGTTWTEYGAFDISQGNGSSIYEGEIVLDFDNLEAEHILITVQSNYGGACSGLSEVFFEVNGVISSLDEVVSANACFDVGIFPNPHRDSFKARINSDCAEPMVATLHDGLGRQIYNEQIKAAYGQHFIDFQDLGIAPGVYYLTIQQGDAIGKYQVVRMK